MKLDIKMMLQTNFWKVLILIVSSVLLMVACEKYKDPPPTEDDRLTNPYCNDPRAINYNHGFPGKPDNSVCIFPVDLFVGNWIFTDTVYAADETILFTDTVNLQMATIQSDDTYSKLEVTGWCGL